MPVIVTIDAQPLTRDAWAPFGWLPVDDTDPGDGEASLQFEWDDAHLNVITHAHDEVAWSPSGASCTGFYRHRTHTQALTPLNVASVMAVAPAAADFSSSADLESVRAFRLRPLDSFVLARGTWHWGPFPMDTEPVRLLNLQGRRYREDNDHVHLVAALDAAIEVRADG